MDKKVIGTALLTASILGACRLHSPSPEIIAKAEKVCDEFSKNSPFLYQQVFQKNGYSLKEADKIFEDMAGIFKYAPPDSIESYKNVCVAFASDDKDKISEYREQVKGDASADMRAKTEKVIQSIDKAKSLLGE